MNMPPVQCEVTQSSYKGDITGLSPYRENLEFCHLVFQAWKMHGMCSQCGKKWNFN